MKRFLQLLFCSALLLGCETTAPEIDGGQEPAKGGIEFAEGTNLTPVFSAEGGSVTVAFTSEYDWSVGTSAEWISVSPESGKAGSVKVSITLSENTSGEERTGTVTITLSNAVTGKITIRQQASENPATPACANNEILYTTSDGKAIELDTTEGFGANIVSNTYENGQGKILFDGDVTAIGTYAFSNCNFTSIVIPNSVTKIGYGAFRYCANLINITIPDGVTEIGAGVFEGCFSLTGSIVIPDSVTEIGASVFAGCIGIERFEGKFASADNRCLILDGALIAFAPAGLNQYTIPADVTIIGELTFFYCYSLANITIPDSVTEIGESAFLSCSSLTSITIPAGVTTMGESVFAYCTNLERFEGKFASADNRCLIFDGALIAFAPAGLTQYTVPDGVTEIGVLAFAECSSLTGITIPDTVTTIGEMAFRYCSRLTSVAIGNSVTTIGNNAFVGCENLPSITIPDSVTSIGRWAFCYCISLSSIYCEPATPPTCDDTAFVDTAFDAGIASALIYVPTVSVEAYKTAAGWSEYADMIIGYDF